MTQISIRVTMAEVAAAAGVHQTTVSLALRGHSRIPAATRERIRAVADKLGYRPNPLVSALISERRRKNHPGYGSTIAFLTSHETRELWHKSYNYSRLYQRLGQEAEALGYRIEPFWIRDPAISPSRLRQIFLARGIRSIIVAPFLWREAATSLRS